MYYFFFFFFQAEDGIRDLYVTGVQTCALPISITRSTSSGGKVLVRAPSAIRSVIGGGEDSWVGAAGAIRSCSLLPRSDKERTLPPQSSKPNGIAARTSLA